MIRACRGGITLLDLIVVIAIVGILLGLVLPALNIEDGPARSSVCTNNLRQLATATVAYKVTRGRLPGYINLVGANDDRRTRSSWVVMTFPYFDKPELWDKWSAGQPQLVPIDMLVCPSDPPSKLDAPNLSYVANAGFIGDADGKENKANGLFFDRTRIADGAPGPSDERDKIGQPIITMKSWRDGSDRTLMLAENIHALYWDYVSAEDQQHTKDRSYHFGFCWEQPAVITQGKADRNARTTRAINRNLEVRETTEYAAMTPDDCFPSSFHPEVVNFAFASGAVRSVHQDIDPLVFAQLMTSDRFHSDLTNSAKVPENELTQPDDADY